MLFQHMVIFFKFLINLIDDDPEWRSPPFELAGRDGYFYGRGTSDDKGPVLAMLLALYHQSIFYSSSNN